MKLPIPYEKSILIFEAFGQIKQKEPIPELILEFITMEIEIFSNDEIRSNQPQMPHKWKILKVLYEILAMFSKGTRVCDIDSSSMIPKLPVFNGFKPIKKYSSLIMPRLNRS